MWTEITADAIDELIEQIIDITDRGDLDALAGLSVSDTGESELAAAMAGMAELSAQRTADEAARQGVSAAPGEPDTERLSASAAAVAAMLAAGLAGAAGREALRHAQTGASASEVAANTRSFLESFSDRELRDRLGGALSFAQNHGKIQTLISAPKGEYVSTEYNDAATCSPCSEIDGTVFESLDDAIAVYAGGGYVWCLGRERCRGTVIAVWKRDEE